MRVLTAFALTLCFACAAFAQPGDSRAERDLKEAAARGNGLPVEISVFNNVIAQAVMIPAADARRIFGKEIGDRYAVVEVNVGNKSPDAALIIHNIFIDYRRWPLSGTRPSPRRLTSLADTPLGRFGQFQSSNRENQIASEEYRVVRGQFFNARTWSGRNKFLRILELAGNVMSAYTFSIKEVGYNKGIAAFSGVVVPGLKNAWPDTSQDQLNLINDLGFKSNKLIPKQGSDVIICFFPIYRFLTPGFADLYKKSPALFFAPLQMLVDGTLEKDVDRVLGKDLGLTPEDVGAELGENVRHALRKRLPCYIRIMNHVQDSEKGEAASESSPLGQLNRSERQICLAMFGLREEVVEEEGDDEDGEDEEPKRVIRFIGASGDDLPPAETLKKFAGFMVLDYFAQVSLNTVGVTIDGAMTVDTNALAASINDLSFDRVANCGGDDAPCFWADPAAGGGVRTGTLRGSYLTGGSVTIAEADDLGIKELKSLGEGSGDQQMRFSFKLSKAVPTETELTFKVTKPKSGNTPLDSQEFKYLASYATQPPRIDKAELSGDTLTVTGDNFFPNELIVRLFTPGNEVLGREDLTLKTPTTTKKLSLDIPTAKKAPGCWAAEVRYGTPPAISPQIGMFAILPTPKVKDATVKAKEKQIVVTGEELIDTVRCNGKPFYFHLVKEEPTDTDVPMLLKPVSRAVGKWVLELPTEAATGAWQVQGMLGGKKAGDPVKLKRP